MRLFLSVLSFFCSIFFFSSLPLYIGVFDAEPGVNAPRVYAATTSA